ncbi:MAG TPA: tetratricopeptide repeat protein [Candidatus Krumholzibacteria bacterium]|nr:tetratricopeptide repeat protein [Candidatus Krumholzibacteria bacterium]
MNDWVVGDRGACAVLLLAGSVLLALFSSRRDLRVAWAVLLVAALTNAALLSLRAGNLINNNNVQQYLGAKYIFPYADFQKLVNAARDEPQVAMRDLEHPMVILRADPRAQRAYFIDLLRDAQVPFDAYVPLDSLRARCIAAGVVRSEAERILSRGLTPDRIGPFRQDVHNAAQHLHWTDIRADYGFNGSPFSALLRHLDPTLHRPFGRGAAWFGLLWQVMGAAIVVWILRLTFEMNAGESLAAGALLFSSWDFVAYALPGLTFVGLWIPVAAAALAMRRGWPSAAGVAIAFAGLIKLFPFALLLVPVSTLAAAGWKRARHQAHSPADAGHAWITIGSCVATVALFGFLSTLGGRSWSDFVAKITAQFGPGSFILNGVSASHMLRTLDVVDLRPALAVALLAAGIMGVLAVSGHERRDQAWLAWLIVVSTGFLAHMWLNYYAIAPLLLFPVMVREHRVGAAVAAASIALSTLLPDFDNTAIRSSGLRALKLAPYLAVPAWMLAVETRKRIQTGAARVSLAVVTAIVLLSVTGVALRTYDLHRAERNADAMLDAGNAPDAVGAYAHLLRRQPANAPVEMNLAVALAQCGRMTDAGAHFVRAAELAPADPIILQNYAMWLQRSGNRDAAVKEYRRLCTLVPWDDTAHAELAWLQFERGETADAASLAQRARELRPDNIRARQLQKRLAERHPNP